MGAIYVLVVGVTISAWVVWLCLRDRSKDDRD
jgi:hypothetical protein